MFFIWNERNVEHIQKHRVEPFEAEEVVRGAKRPYPRSDGGEKYIVRGRTKAGRRIQVIYVYRPPESIDLELLQPDDRVRLMEDERAIYVIHSRDLRRGEN